MNVCGRWTGREVVAFREAVRLKQEKFADWAGVSVEAVKKWERRKETIRLSAPYAERMDRKLQDADADAAVVERFWSLLDESITVKVDAGHKLGPSLESGADTDYVLVRTRTITGEVVLVSLPRCSLVLSTGFGSTVAMSSSSTVVDTSGEGDADLRDFVSVGGDWPPLPNKTPDQGISGFDGMSLQESGEHILRTFLHLDDELGGDSLYVPLSKYVARMAVSVRANPHDGLAVFGQLNQMVGWLALDANKHPHAKRYLTAAVEVGHEVADHGLVASALGYMSLQETYRGRPVPARSLAQMAFREHRYPYAADANGHGCGHMPNSGMRSACAYSTRWTQTSPAQTTKKNRRTSRTSMRWR